MRGDGVVAAHRHAHRPVVALAHAQGQREASAHAVAGDGERRAVADRALVLALADRAPDADHPARALVGDGVGDRGVLVQAGARLLRVPHEQLVEVLPRPDGPEVREAGEGRPLQLEGDAAADHPQALVVQPAVLLGAVDAEVDQLLHAARGEAVAAHLGARERGLLQQQDVETGPGQVRGGRRSGGTGADDDHVGVACGGFGRSHAAPCERIHEVGDESKHPGASARAPSLPDSDQYFRNARCSATAPSARSRHATRSQPALPMRTASSGWGDQSRIDSPR